ncbi:MAG: hypothetical protein ABSG83_19420 [Roseiarcus sp.]|jgi:putative oxidoreductase
MNLRAVHGAAGSSFDNGDGGRDFPALWIVGLALAPGRDGAFALRRTPFGAPARRSANMQEEPQP